MKLPADSEWVSKEQFRLRLPNYVALYPFRPGHIGRTNPYTGKRIASEADYYEYARERLFHVMCEEAYRRQRESYIVRLMRRFFLLFLCGLAAFIFVALPQVQESSYDAGYSAGHDVGYSTGESSGYASGFAKGKDDGYLTGHADGMTVAYDSAYSDGYASGYADGRVSVIINSSSGSYGSSAGTSETGQQADNSVTTVSTTVYVTDSGSKYHRAGCSYLKSSNEITLSAAKAQGYSPCSRCNPPT